VLIFVLAAILYGIGDENPNVPALADGTHPEVTILLLTAISEI
jgi:hypothetical protein